MCTSVEEVRTFVATHDQDFAKRLDRMREVLRRQGVLPPKEEWEEAA